MSQAEGVKVEPPLSLNRPGERPAAGLHLLQTSKSPGGEGSRRG
jgi:hypothetical protein